MQADVILSGPLPEDVEAELREWFSEVGADPRVRSVPARRGWTEVQWMVLATVPLQAFLSAFAAKAADDAYTRLKRLTHRLAESSSHQPGDYHPFVLQDAATRLKVVLEPDLPAAAYRQLAALDLTQFKRGPLHYDQARSRWRSELDEAENPRHRRRSSKDTHG